MAGMFMTISRVNVKAGSEKEARALLEKEMNPGDGKKPGDDVEGLVLGEGSGEHALPHVHIGDLGVVPAHCIRH